MLPGYSIIMSHEGKQACLFRIETVFTPGSEDIKKKREKKEGGARR